MPFETVNTIHMHVFPQITFIFTKINLDQIYQLMKLYCMFQKLILCIFHNKVFIIYFTRSKIFLYIFRK